MPPALPSVSARKRTESVVADRLTGEASL